MKNYDEMNSKESKRRSRRSSILKAPKPRQPLQNVELSPSHSTENSPCPSATKIRRRVSFAEKKHVKEFCDSAEQGTVWDNTYEESDSSHIRNSQNSNNDENIAPNGRPNDLSKEQVDTPLQLINGSKTCDAHSMQDQYVNSAALKTVVSSINYEAANTLNTKDIEHHETNGMEFGLDRINAVDIEHPELAPMLENKKITIFCDNSIDARLEENAAFPQNPQSTQSETNTELFISTGESMIPQKDPSEKTLVFSNKSMDFTEVVKTTSNITMPQQTSPESTTIFHNVSVDFTEIVENIKEVEEPLDKTTLCFNNTVDFTEIVENIPTIPELTPEKTIVFHDASINFTEVIDNIGKSEEETEKSTLEKTMIFNDVFVDITEAVSNIPSNGKASSDIFERTSSSEDTLKNCIDSNGTNLQQANYSMMLHDQSMEITKAIPSVLSAGKRIVEESPSHPYTGENCLTNSSSNYKSMAEGKTMVFHNVSMELTGAVQFPLQTTNDNPLNNGKQQCESKNLAHIEKDCRTMIFHDDSMEFTQVQSSSKPKPIPVQDKENCLTAMEDCPRKDFPRGARQLQKENILETLENDDNPLNNGKQQCESKNLAVIEKDCRTMIFHDDSMEFTQVQSSSKPKPIPVQDKENCLTAMEDCPRKDFPRGVRQLQKENILETLENDDNPLNNEKQQCESKNPADIEKDCRTMIFHDDSMEFTQVQSSSKPKPIPVRDKENCLTAMEDCPRKDFPHAARQSQKENILETLENKFMKMITSVKFPSLRENEESLENRSVTTDGRRTHDCIAQDISGVSPLNSQTINFKHNPQDVQNLEKSREVVTFQNDDMELSQIQQRSEETENNSINHETDNNPLKLSTRLLPNITLSLEQIQQNVSKGTNVEMINVLQTPKVPNATEFDEETFLLQRALCLKSHEADSIASQESSSRPLTFVEDQPILMDIGRQKSPIATMEFLSGTKLVESNDETFAARFSTTVDQADCDKSLEELRAKASSVIRFCPEDTAYELTERINRIFPSDFHESSMSEDLQTEEPPSFGFAYSITEDSVSSANASSNKLDPFLDKENIKSVDIMEEASSFPVSQFVERKSAASPIVAMELPEITTTMVQQVGNYNDGRNNASPVERMVRKEIHRSQTRSDVFVPEVNLSSVDCDPTITDCVKNHSSCKIGLTTASEFSSESTNGPSVKLRRGDDDSTKEESRESEKRSLVIAEPWSNRYFANSTAIGNDLEQSSPHQNIDDNFNPVKNSFIDELSSIIVSNKGRNVNESALDEARTKERIDHITKNLEMSDYKSSFFALKQTIENLSKRLDVIWDINRLDEKIVAFNFFSKSIVLAVYLEEDSDSSTVNGIKDVVLLSQLVKERTDPGLCLAHDLIMKTMDNAFLKRSCQSYEEIPQLLEHVSSRVKLGMDFAFELDRLRNHNVMEIDENRITFIARARDINAGIILNVTMVIKPFEEIDHNDITVSYLLGGEKIRKNYIERLITNVKRDHRFLRFYMADVKDYIDLMAEMGSTNR